MGINHKVHDGIKPEPFKFNSELCAALSVLSGKLTQADKPQGSRWNTQ